MTLQKLVGIDLPIIQAPMAGVQGSALAVAVSSAGGLGSLPCAMLDPEAMRRELTAIRAQTTRPFNVNFFCHAQPEVSLERERAWRAALSPYFAEYGIDAASIAMRPGRTPFGAAIADVLSEFKPPVVSFHFGLPSPDLFARVRSWSPKILSSATTVDEARWLEAHGVDAVIALPLLRFRWRPPRFCRSARRRKSAAAANFHPCGPDRTRRAAGKYQRARLPASWLAPSEGPGRTSRAAQYR